MINGLDAGYWILDAGRSEAEIPRTREYWLRVGEDLSPPSPAGESAYRRD
ncbi:MAG: hypothetical protein GQ561_00070 [Calditrichae bacterium]|nr:hypothetical protein [Calditrichia bacterium]